MLHSYWKWQRFTIALFILVVSSGVHAQTADIDDIKVAFILNFASYTTWPDELSASGTLALCAFGSKPLAGKLTRIEGSKVGDKTISIRLLKNHQQLDKCNLLYLSVDDEQRLDEITAGISGLPILTITDITSPAAENSIMIRLQVYSGRMRFEINLLKARQAGLELSSQLLRLARKVQQ